MSASRCPACDAPCRGPYYRDDVKSATRNEPLYIAYGGRRAFLALFDGIADSRVDYGGTTGLYRYVIEPDTYRDAPQPVAAFFSSPRLSRFVSPATASDVLAALQTLIEAVRTVALGGVPCPTCGGPSFEQGGMRYAYRGSPTVTAAGLALYAVPSGEVTPDGQPIPFFSERFLYDKIGKDAARSVLALIHEILRTANLEQVWLEFG